MVHPQRYRSLAVSIGRVAFMILTLSCGSQVSAEIITVVNAGFENTTGSIIFNEFSFGAPPGWNLYDPNNVTSNGDGPTYYIGTLRPASAPNPTEFFTSGAPEGQRVGIAFNFANSGGGGEYGFAQTLSATLQANTIYTLNVDIGNIGSGTAVNGDFFNLSGFPGYRVDLLAGGTVIAQDINSIGSTIPNATFATSTLTFQTGTSHAQLNQSLGIRLVNLNTIDFTNATTQAADLEVDFDNVRFSSVTAVPEPSSLLLFVIGGIWAYRYRRVCKRTPNSSGCFSSPPQHA